MHSEADLRSWMRLAVDLGKRSVAEDDLKPHVGAVVVRDNRVIGSGYRGLAGEGNHAEYGVLLELAESNLIGAQVFTTLEPCSNRNHPKIPCARRLVDAGVSEVWIGIYDPNPVIYRQGWRILRDAGIQLHDFPADLRDEIAIDNVDFIRQYKMAAGDAGEVTLDSRETASGTVVKSSIGDFTVRTSPMGAGGVWLIDNQRNVAAIRYGEDFDQIDDPGAYNFGNSHYAALGVGQMACLRGTNGYLLLKNVSSRRPPNVIDLLYQVRGRPTPTRQREDPNREN